MYANIDDHIKNKKGIAETLQSHVSGEARKQALRANQNCKDMIAYAKDLQSMSYGDILEEYNTASDAILEADAEIRQISDDIQTQILKLTVDLKAAEERSEAAVLKIATIADALRTYADILPAQQQTEAAKPKPTPDYIGALEVHYGKAKVRGILTEEGYDVSDYRV